MTRALLFAMALSMSGCGSAGDGARVVAVHDETVRADDETVIATVDGRPIRAAQVKLQATAAGTTPRAALDALIDAEVAAGEARRRGLADDPSVKQEIEGELVRRFLAETFEKQVTIAAVTDEDVNGAYRKNQVIYDHPEMVLVRHILAESTTKDDAVRRAALRARMVDVAAAARGIGSPDAFSALAQRFSDHSVPSSPHDIKLLSQENSTDRDTMTVPPFAQAAFALVHPGDTSGVVETSYGFHVIYLVDRKLARHDPVDKVAPEVRAALWPSVRKRELGRFVDQLVEHHTVAVAPQLLDEPATP